MCRCVDQNKNQVYITEDITNTTSKPTGFSTQQSGIWRLPFFQHFPVFVLFLLLFFFSSISFKLIQCSVNNRCPSIQLIHLNLQSKHTMKRCLQIRGCGRWDTYSNKSVKPRLSTQIYGVKDNHRTSVIHTDSDQVLSVFTQNHVLKLFLRILKKKNVCSSHGNNWAISTESEQACYQRY